MYAFDLDKELIAFTDKEGKTSWTARDAVEGVQIFGGIGSGKTSGSGRFIALKYLSNQFGGLILTVKPDEKEMWQQYCKITSREKDLLIIEPGSKHFFNFLAYESTPKGTDTSITSNIVQVLKTVIRASEEKSTGKSDDPFWETALDMLMFNIIELSLLAYGTVSVQQLYNIAQSIPKPQESTNNNPANPEEQKLSYYNAAFKAADAKISGLITAWENTQDKDQIAAMSDQEYNEAVCNAVPEARRFKYVDEFITDTFINLSEKTRSIIDFSVTGFLFRLLQEPVFSLFCRHPSNFIPEDCFNKGKIILINLPVKQYHKVGRDAQILFKYIWQRAMEQRDTSISGRPVFLWADEAQNFLHEYDADYQATARSSRIATVYISQNLPNYFANMGGDKGQYKVKSFLGTLGTKFFHANADSETNNYASQMIGEAYQKDESVSTAVTDGKTTLTTTVSSRLARMVRPEEFGMLITGGPLNEQRVTGYMHVQGKRFSNGFNYRKISFNQNATL